MGATLVEKIIARGAHKEKVVPGEIVFVDVDRVLINDYAGKIVFSEMERWGWENSQPPEKILFSFDHCVPPFTVAAADQLVLCRKKCQRYNIVNVGEIGRHGIGHQLMVEHFTKPGEIALGTDSHATMYGGVGAFACGITSTDAAVFLKTGKTWINVPKTIRIIIDGTLKHGVTAKDISLTLMRMLPSEEAVYRALEIVGTTVDALSVESRLVMANMLAECGAKCVIFQADEKTKQYTGYDSIEMLRSDEDAAFEAVIRINADELEPVMAFPHSIDNVRPIAEAVNKHVDQVFIGSCTNGRLEDFEQASEILKGRKVAKNTRLVVVPSSQLIYKQMLESGVLEIMLEAGAAVMTPSCASCFGNGPGLIGAGECCVSTTNRNFKGRMGSKDGEIFLASAYTAAAAAVAGMIADPREYLTGGRS